MKRDAWEIITLVFVLAMIYLLVKPSSLGPTLIQTTGEALANVVTFAVSS